MTCITPRALASETIELLKPLSCQAIAAASDGGDAVLGGDGLHVGGADALRRRRPGSALGTTCSAGAGCADRAGAGAPLGSLITVPVSSRPAGSSPFMAAICGDGDARRGGEARQRVAGAHDVGALGRRAAGGRRAVEPWPDAPGEPVEAGCAPPCCSAALPSATVGTLIGRPEHDAARSPGSAVVGGDASAW